MLLGRETLPGTSTSCKPNANIDPPQCCQGIPGVHYTYGDPKKTDLITPAGRKQTKLLPCTGLHQ